MKALPENLWTNVVNTTDFHWANPCPESLKLNLLKWHRTEFGLFWNYFIVDQCIEHPCWYARLDIRVLIIYAFMSILGTTVLAWLVLRTPKS